MQKIGLVGLGLIGGSLAKAFKTKCGINNIVAFNRTEAPLITALDDGVITSYTTTIDETFNSCDVVFICTPVNTIKFYAEKLLPFVGSKCIITDVGSTKNKIFEDISNIKNINFIGGHPMAGLEKTGYDASTHILFENAYYVLTPMETTKKDDYNFLEELVKSIGGIPIKLDPKVHDHAVAGISHVPHVVASALVNCVKNSDDDKQNMHLLAAGGFKDITRIASSSPDIWNSICIENKTEVLKILNDFKTELNLFEESLLNDDTYNFFETSKQYRDSFSSKKVVSYFKFYELKVDVEDKPGMIAAVAALLGANQVNIKNIGIMNNRDYTDGFMRIEFDSQDQKEKAKTLLENMNFSVYDSK